MKFNLLILALKHCLSTPTDTQSAPPQNENTQNTSSKNNKDDANPSVNFFLPFVDTVLSYCKFCIEYLAEKEDGALNGKDIEKLFSGLENIKKRMDENNKKENWLLSVVYLFGGYLSFKDKESSGKESSGKESSVKESSVKESSVKESSGKESSGKESSGKDNIFLKSSEAKFDKNKMQLIKFGTSIPKNQRDVLILEILQGNFDNVPITLYIEDTFIDYFLDKAEIKSKEEYNNVSRFLNKVKDQKEPTYTEKLKKIISEEYIPITHPVHNFVLPLLRFFINKYDLIIETANDLRTHLPKQESQKAMCGK